MKVLITGSAGFIGKHLMERLKKKHEVLGIDKKSGVDILDFQKMLAVMNKIMGKPDVIVHLAAQTSRKNSSANPSRNFQDNIIGTFNILEIARSFGIKVIFPSTRYAVPNKEGQRDPYGTSKAINEVQIEDYAQNFGLEYIINRIGNVYGPGQEGSQEAFWLAWFIKASIEKKPITIYGFEGKQSRDMLHVKDLVDLIVDEVENFPLYQGQTFEVGGSEKNEISLIEALKIIGYDNYNFGKALPGDSKRLVFDNKKIAGINGWFPKIPIREGIGETIEYYKKLKKGKK